jgi:hypothetical protein
MLLADLIGRAADGLREIEKACPCRLTEISDGSNDNHWTCTDEFCRCAAPKDITLQLCTWPGHAAIARAREVLREIVEAWPTVKCPGNHPAGEPDQSCPNVIREQERAAANKVLDT